MRQVLHQRFGALGMGEANPQPRPVIGSPFVAGGFIIPALLGSEILFSMDAAPQPRPVQLTPDQIDRLEKPDFRQTWPMNELIGQMDALEAKWGYLVGDVNTDGLLNAAYHLYGVDLFTDFYSAPQRVERLLDLIAELIGDVADYVRQRTGTCSVSVNRMVERVNPSLFSACQLLGANDLAEKLSQPAAAHRATHGGALATLWHPSLRGQPAALCQRLR